MDRYQDDTIMSLWKELHPISVIRFDLVKMTGWADGDYCIMMM
jgi:hypothetical protein